MDNWRSETVAAVNSCFAVVTEEEILQVLTFLDCLLLPSWYILIQLIFSISVNSGFKNIHLSPCHALHVGDCSVTIHLDSR